MALRATSSKLLAGSSASALHFGLEILNSVSTSMLVGEEVKSPLVLDSKDGLILLNILLK